MASPAFTFSGASGSLAALSTTAGATVTATLDNLAGVGQCTWTIVSTDDSASPSDYTLVTSGSYGSTVTFTALGEGTGGLLKLTINAGIDPQTGEPSAAMSTQAMWTVPLPNGTDVGVTGEGYEYNSTHGWNKKFNAVARAAATTSTDNKRSVRLATATTLPANTRSGNVLTANANGSINGTGIDGKTDIALNQRILVKDEATGANNGLFYVSQLGDGSNPWKLTRSTDADTSAELSTGATVYVEEGTANSGTMWQLQTLSVVLNTTAQTWKAIPGISDKSDLDAATSAATANKLVRRGASAEASFAALTGTTVTASSEFVGTQIDTGAATDLTVQRNNTNILAVNSTGVRLSGALANAIVDIGTAATGLDLKIRAGTSTAGNADGGDVLISGATANGSGLKGGVQLNLSTDTDVMVETREVATGRRFVALARGSAITSTQLPANTGDLLVYVGDAATAATAAPVGGFILQSVSGVPTVYKSGGSAAQAVLLTGDADIPTKHQRVITDALSTDATAEEFVYICPKAGGQTIVNMFYVFYTSVSANATNYGRILLKTYTAGGAAIATIVQRDTSSSGFSANAPDVLSFYGGATGALSYGDSVRISFTKPGGTGVIFPPGCLVLFVRG